MAKIAKKLTDTEIKNTKPAEKEINLRPLVSLQTTQKTSGGALNEIFSPV